MSLVGWRRAALVLGALCIFLQWRACHRPRPRALPCVEEARAAGDASRRGDLRRDRDRELGDWAHQGEPERPRDEEPAAPQAGGPSLFGVKVPPWVRWMAPQPGEHLLDYRDRMVPLAQAAVAPHRARLARSRADLVTALGLDSRQQAELDAAIGEAAGEIQDKVMNAALSGELAPSQLKPMTGVRLARDVLQLVDQADRRFTSTLDGDQKARLARHPFDVADYLLFSTRWENALGVK